MTVRIKKADQTKLSPQMALLHLRWQQIRWELLQQAQQLPLQDNLSSHPAIHKEAYATA